MAFLDGKVRLVMLQFSSFEIDLRQFGIESSVETDVRLIKRKSQVKHRGRECLSLRYGVVISQFLSDLKNAGYQLVSAFHQIRVEDEKILRFTFSANEYAELSDSFLEIRPQYESALNHMAEKHIWKPKAFLNQFFEEDKPVEDQFILMVNLEGNPWSTGARVLLRVDENRIYSELTI